VAVAREKDQKIERKATKQHGVLSREQAFKFGLKRGALLYRVKEGGWVEMYPNVYRLPGTASTWVQKLTGAALWAKFGYAFSHRCAAALWGFERYKTEVVELSTTRNLRCEPPPRVHRVLHLPDSDIKIVQQFRVTSVPRTLIDLAEEEDFEDVRACLNQALARRHTTLAELEDGFKGKRPGEPALRELVRKLKGGDGACESELEERVYALFERNGLPKPIRQEQHLVDGKLVRLDFHVPKTMLVIEAEGYAYHSGFDVFESDRRRGNSVTSDGYFVLRWTWDALTQRPDELVGHARRVIARGPRPEDLVKAAS